MTIRKKALAAGLIIGVAAVVGMLASPRSSSFAREAPAATNDAVAASELDQTTAGWPVDIMECFNLQKGNDPNAVARLTTKNFGGDLVKVRQAALMCEQAAKQRAGQTTGQPGPYVFECFRLQAGNVINDPYMLTTKNFGPNKVVVRQLVAMCETAAKAHNGAVTTPPDDHVLACYTVAQGSDPKAPVTLLTRNFEQDPAVVRRAVLMCEEAMKERPPNAAGTPTTFGQATGLVWECFALQQTKTRNAPLTLTTKNFGGDDAVAVRGTLMCERAEKAPLFTDPTGGGGQPGAADVPGAE